MMRDLAKEIHGEERLVTEEDTFPLKSGLTVANEEYLAEERQNRTNFHNTEFQSKIMRMTRKRQSLKTATKRAKNLKFVSFNFIKCLTEFLL